MERVEIKQIADYVKDLEEGLMWDYDRITLQVESPYLYQIIQRLMDATFKAEDQQLKPLRTMLEYKAYLRS